MEPDSPEWASTVERMARMSRERNLADEFMPPSVRVGDVEARRLGLMLPADVSE